MISKIEIDSTATFQHETLDELKEFNYLFGVNGTGKTTISRLIDSADKYPSCSVTWKTQAHFETQVYNKDFVDRNFKQQSLKGVFSLGETAQGTLDRIDIISKNIKTLQHDISTLETTLHGTDGKRGKQAELAKLQGEYKEKFFKMKQKYADKLSGPRAGEGMRGNIGSKDIFMAKVLEEAESNTATLLQQAQLEEKAQKVFSSAFALINPLTEISVAELSQHELNPILQKKIIGKDDVDIARMISKLDNSDWVRQGFAFYDANDGVCPFCQRKTSETFRQSLLDYFDETFKQDSDAIKTLINDYSGDSQRLQEKIQALIDLQSSFVDIEKLKTEKRLLDSVIEINKQRLLKKEKEKSILVVLDSHENVLEKIAELITTANTKIAENNRIVDNLESEKATLTSQVWRFVVSELEPDIIDYNKKKTDLDRAIDSIKSQLQEKNKKKTQEEGELKILRMQTNSIVPTKDGINRLLGELGFKSFQLAVVDESNTYKLIREDGSDAGHTLSEGETNFLAFLYFYYLLKGSQNEAGIDSDKVVVIDDPVSSLDNDVLFIVCTLIRELIEDVRNKKGSIKQIFILTHNIYFHKEVTFNKKRKNVALSEETFWIIKKDGKFSIVKKHADNPIKTSYELLWDEVRKAPINNATIQNTLRRILENYFKRVGGIDLNDLHESFNGDDKKICNALCSWVNDGSHSVWDEDYYTAQDPVMITRFLEMFKEIFEKKGHKPHYDMMMGINSEAENS